MLLCNVEWAAVFIFYEGTHTPGLTFAEVQATVHPHQGMILTSQSDR